MADAVQWYVDPDAVGGGTGVDWANAYTSLNAWEMIDSDGTTAADTDFDMQGTVTTSLSDYYDGSNWIACRVWQEAK